MNQMVRPPALPASVAFTGERGEFRRLVTRGALLELITVGFYRFWLATDIRRHLWSHTGVDGDAFEYTGRGKELLIGFLFALAIIVPIYLAYFLVGLEAERFKAFASFPLVAFFYVFGQFAIYRARRYRLTRTVWRGVRFWMTGSGWAYAARAALWMLLVPLTLGLILPWREAALERYKMRHSHYGDLQGSFEGRGSELFKRGWWIWLVAVATFLVLVLAVPLAQWFPGLLPLAKVISGAAGLFIPIGAPFLYGIFKAVEWRWWISGIRFGEVRLESALPRGALFGLYWKVIGWFVLVAAVFSGYLFLSATAVASLTGTSIAKIFTPGNLQGGVPILVLAGIGYLGFILTLNVVLRVYLLRDLWVRLVGSTTVYGIDAAANVAVTGDLASAVGEGLADGLDVVGF
ncbi:MAG: YjgN family protein [Bradyrhizobium sp.]